MKTVIGNGIIYQGHVLDVLPTLPDELVHCVVTSPPYWGLRDYDIEPQIWDGVEACEHGWGDNKIIKRGHAGKSTLGGTQTAELSKSAGNQGQFCIHCNAWRGSLGLEPTPELYISHLVAIFREIRRVLRTDGTVWLNLADSYAGSWGNSGHRPERTGVPGHQRDKNTEWFKRQGHAGDLKAKCGLKPKDLCGIPWRVALALQAGFCRCDNCGLEMPTVQWPVWQGHRVCLNCYAKNQGNLVIGPYDGWWLRSDIVWSKPNPMPESVKDRPTRSHEYVFLLSKNQKYYFDQDTVREPHQDVHGLDRFQGKCGIGERQDNQGWSGGTITLDKHREYNPKGRNIRTVWTIPTQPYLEAHFATFPEKLVEPCIKAGCPPDGTVLDPFMGSGTVGLVTEKLNRKWRGIEIKPEYCQLIERRVYNEAVQMKLL